MGTHNEITQKYEQLLSQHHELQTEVATLKYQLKITIQERINMQNNNIASPFPTSSEIKDTYIEFNTQILANLVFEYHSTSCPDFIYQLVPTCIEKGKQQMDTIFKSINLALFPTTSILHPLPEPSNLFLAIRDHLQLNYKSFVVEDPITILSWFPKVTTFNEKYQNEFVGVVKSLNSLVWQVQLSGLEFRKDVVQTQGGKMRMLYCSLRGGNEEDNVICYPLVRKDKEGKSIVIQQGYVYTPSLD